MLSCWLKLNIISERVRILPFNLLIRNCLLKIVFGNFLNLSIFIIFLLSFHFLLAFSLLQNNKCSNYSSFKLIFGVIVGFNKIFKTSQDLLIHYYLVSTPPNVYQ